MTVNRVLVRVEVRRRAKQQNNRDLEEKYHDNAASSSVKNSSRTQSARFYSSEASARVDRLPPKAGKLLNKLLNNAQNQLKIHATSSRQQRSPAPHRSRRTQSLYPANRTQHTNAMYEAADSTFRSKRRQRRLSKINYCKQNSVLQTGNKLKISDLNIDVPSFSKHLQPRYRPLRRDQHGIDGRRYHTIHKPKKDCWGMYYKNIFETPTISSMLKARHPVFVRYRKPPLEELQAQLRMYKSKKLPKIKTKSPDDYIFRSPKNHLKNKKKLFSLKNNQNDKKRVFSLKHRREMRRVTEGENFGEGDLANCTTEDKGTVEDVPSVPPRHCRKNENDPTKSQLSLTAGGCTKKVIGTIVIKGAPVTSSDSSYCSSSEDDAY